MEEWRDVEGYENIYKVSNKGRYKSFKYKKEKILPLSKDHYGYIQCTLSKDGIKVKAKLHCLIANAFIPNPKNKPQINHKNGIKTDNYVENLERSTSIENNDHARKLKLIKTKLDKIQILEIREKYKTGKYTYVQLSKEYNVSPEHISRIIKYKNWKHI